MEENMLYKTPSLGVGAFLIIPAIDIIEGKCVRLSQGDYAQKTIYNENPLEVAKQFEDAGIKRVHLVDLDGAKKGAIVNKKVLETIASKTKLVIDFGGGIKTDADIQFVYDAGASIATIGSLAVKNPELFFGWVRKYGAAKILLGADVKQAVPGPKGKTQSLSGYNVAISGWTEQTDIPIFEFIKQNLEKGVRNIFCTDISKDGMMQGSSIELYKKILGSCQPAHFSELEHESRALRLIASGGVNSVKDIQKLQQAGCAGVIIGKALYEGNIQLAELNAFF